MRVCDRASGGIAHKPARTASRHVGQPPQHQVALVHLWEEIRGTDDAVGRHVHVDEPIKRRAMCLDPSVTGEVDVVERLVVACSDDGHEVGPTIEVLHLAVGQHTMTHAKVFGCGATVVLSGIRACSSGFRRRFPR